MSNDTKAVLEYLGVKNELDESEHKNTIVSRCIPKELLYDFTGVHCWRDQFTVCKWGGHSGAIKSGYWIGKYPQIIGLLTGMWIVLFEGGLWVFDDDVFNQLFELI